MLVCVWFITEGAAQGTTFTYQGTLQENLQPANGSYDFEFRLFDAEANGAQIGPTVSALGVAVAEGAFTVSLDFGDQFPGANRWLEIRVRNSALSPSNANLGGFTLLAPRQPIRTVPYAVRSTSAALADSATTANFANTAGTATTSGSAATADFATSAGTASSADSAATANNALQLGGVGAAQYVLTTDPRLSDARPPTPGSISYIQNTLSQQSSSNFNIDGTGSANVLNVVSEYDLGGNRLVTSLPASAAPFGHLFIGVGTGTAILETLPNSFVGTNSGASIDTGGGNTFVGYQTGMANESGNANSFFGHRAGESSTGALNSYFGWGAGQNLASGFNNSFFGVAAGLNSTTGSWNSFFGSNAGSNSGGSSNVAVGHNSGLNTTGDFNTFLGTESGIHITTGESNVMVGRASGFNFSSGSENVFVGAGSGEMGGTGTSVTLLGFDAEFASGGLQNATAIGSKAMVSQNDSLVLGSIQGLNGATTTVKVGVGTDAPRNRLEIGGAVLITGPRDSFTGNGLTVSSETSYDLIQSFNNRPLVLNGIGNSVGINNTDPQDKLDVTGKIRVSSLGTAGATALCHNNLNQISSCSSSLRYKSGIRVFSGGSGILKGLRPVTFSWKDSGNLDLGLVAEEVAEIEPLLVTYNSKGEIEGVKYDKIGVVLVNVVKEQQRTIEIQSDKLKAQGETLERQADELDALKTELAALKALVCSANPGAEVCSGMEQD